MVLHALVRVYVDYGELSTGPEWSAKCIDDFTVVAPQKPNYLFDASNSLLNLVNPLY